MEVIDIHKISSDHSIEWGNSTWDSGIEKSIRSRYDNAKGGKYNWAGSAEVPWHDFNTMINESIKRQKFTPEEIKEIIKNISDYYI